MTADGPLGRLRGPRPPIAWEAPAKAPKDARTDRVWIGADPHGLGFEVAVAAWAGDSSPTLEALRALHAGRLKSRAVPLCVALHDDRGRAWVLGPLAAAPALGPLPEAQAARLLQAALAEPTASAARARILQARDAFESAEIPGFDSQGLFAIRELTWGVPRRPDWPAASERSRAILAATPRSSDLVRGLGFDTRDIPGNALLLTVGDDPPRAVAIMLKDDEAFDAESPRFGRSPIYHGLDIARRNNVRWLVVVRGSQIRLYPTAPDVGVGRRGATQTYFGLDLALLDDAHAGYLSLAFGGDALRPGGSADEILDASRDYAVSLGERLRDRIYADVIDRLSVAVANAVAAGGALDEDRLAFSYRLTLRVLFRLLFQAYAEDTHLLPLHRNDRYTRASLKELARDFAAHPERQNDPNSTSLWDGLQQVWRVIDKGDSAWGIPAYNGGLFGADPELQRDGAAIAVLRLSNDTIGPALAGLLVDRGPDGERGPVDFRSLDVRDFGTIYEGLLESGISLAPEDLTLDANDAWRPAKPGESVHVRAGDPYFHSKSGDRKATGSYFTKPFAVEHLLARALDPALDAHLARVGELVEKGDQVGAARLFFDFRVADLAMGSGHFLVAAIGRIEAKFGSFLERMAIPGVERELLDLRSAAEESLARVGVEAADIDRSALLGRQIARRCVYGLDINDIAVELARLAIWVRTFVPGLPMSSLDHQLVSADSLTGIGTIDEAVSALDPDARAGILTFSGLAISEALDRSRRVLEDAAALKESNIEEARASQEAARVAFDVATTTRRIFDAAVAVRLGIVQPPTAFDAADLATTGAAHDVQASLASLRAAHFPALFPEVFLRSPAGFDVLVGNPPWDKLHVETHQWWGLRYPGLRGMTTRDRDERIEKLGNERPDLVAQLAADVTSIERARKAVASGPYPGIGAAHLDLFAAFAWRNWMLLREGGRLGLVLPRTAFSGAATEEWRRQILRDGAFETVTFIANTNRWAFDEVDGRYTFALAVARRSPSPTLGFSGPFHSMSELVASGARSLEVPVQDFLGWTGTAAFPLFPTAESGDVFRVFREHPSFSSAQGFEFRPVQGDLNATADRAVFGLGNPTGAQVPVLAGASFALWAPDFGDAYGNADWKTLAGHLLRKAHTQVKLARSALYGAAIRTDADLPITSPRIAFRDVARPTDSRTVICALLPAKSALIHTAPYLFRRKGDERDEAYLLGVMSSIPFDWCARRVVEIHLTFELLATLPVPRPDRADPIRRRVEVLAGRLASVDDRYSGWAARVGVPVGSVATEAEREDLLAELDANVAGLYGLSRSQLTHVFSTFHRGWDFAERLGRVLAHFDRLDDHA